MYAQGEEKGIVRLPGKGFIIQLRLPGFKGTGGGTRTAALGEGKGKELFAAPALKGILGVGVKAVHAPERPLSQEGELRHAAAAAENAFSFCAQCFLPHTLLQAVEHPITPFSLL
jgi:hypothetical protein